MRAVFVTHPQAVSSSPGGLQICTDEFLRSLGAGGFDVTMALIEHDRRLLSRLRQRITADPYPAQWEPRAVADIADAVSRCGAGYVFLNLVNLAPLAPQLKRVLPEPCRIVMLSHGLESVDYVHTVPHDGWTRRHERELGRRLLAERAHRRSIDHVLCLTTFEAEIERWLGAKSVTPVPRTVSTVPPLVWRPDGRRLGFVGTLDHHPTRLGLADFLDALTPLASRELEVRIVGGPESAGRDFASRFSSVRYLGPLDDGALREEAGSWSACLHPLFCWARGCSTKLAVALAWQIPIVTTPAGARGYTWRRGQVSMAETPASFAALACTLTERTAADAARRDVIQAAQTMPTIDEVGALIARALTGSAADRHPAWA
jgi:hypothetical protein